MADTLIKPAIPAVTLPATFGGMKTEFSETKVQNGFLEGTPDILAGDNLNFWLDTDGKNQEYLRAVVDFIRNCPIGKVVSVNSSNQLYYTTVLSEEYVQNRIFETGDVIASFKTSRAGFLLLDGSLLQISEFPELYEIFGTTFGGDGITTFALPDARNRVLQGAGTRLANMEYIGSGLPKPTVTASTASAGAHTHGLPGASSACAGGGRAIYIYGASDASPTAGYRTSSSAGAHTHTMTVTVATSGAYGASTEVQQPALGINYFVKI